MSQYFIVRIENVSNSAEEWLSSQVFEFGALGMSEVLGFRQPEGEEDVFTQIPDRRAVDVYFPQTPDPGFLNLLRERWPDTRASINAEVEKDWLAEWKKGFVPFALTEDHWVVPSWCEAPREAKHKILIDPGMAFGTGTHETTKLVAQELNSILRNNDGKPLSLLDVGTGTGILAILAKQLGCQPIYATEIEPEARRVARENFVLNAAADIRLNEKQIEQLQPKFDLVLANIIDGVLVRIQDQLKEKVKPGGWLILSGIITEREPDFLAGFKLPAGVTWNQRRQMGDWLLYAVQLP